MSELFTIDKPTYIPATADEPKIIRNNGGGTLYLSPSAEVSPALSTTQLTQQTQELVDTGTWIVGDEPVSVLVDDFAPPPALSKESEPSEAPPQVPAEPTKAKAAKPKPRKTRKVK